MIKSFVQSEDLKKYFAESFSITNKQIEELQKEATTPEQKAKLKEKWLIVNSYESRAWDLTFAERKVNLESIERAFDKFEKELIKNVTQLTQEQQKELVAKIKKAVDTKDYDKLQKLTVAFKWQVAKEYAKVMKELFEAWKKTTSNEMWVDSPTTSKEIAWLYKAQALQLEAKLASDMENVAKEEALYSVNKGLTTAATINQVEKALNQKIDKVINASTTQAMGWAFNTWRTTVYEANMDKVYGFQYTAVLDRRTTNLCRSLNGRVIAKDDADFFKLSPPNHPKCRSFWVEILNDELIKPKITKIPKSISRDRTGYTNFQDLQKVEPYTPTPADNKIAKQKTEALLEDIKKEL